MLVIGTNKIFYLHCLYVGIILLLLLAFNAHSRTASPKGVFLTPKNVGQKDGANKNLVLSPPPPALVKNEEPTRKRHLSDEKFISAQSPVEKKARHSTATTTISLFQRNKSVTAGRTATAVAASTSVVSVATTTGGGHHRRHLSIGEMVKANIDGLHERWHDVIDKLQLQRAVIRSMLKTPKRVEQMLKVLMYLSRVDPEEDAIVIGVRTLKSLGENIYLVERLMEFSAKEIGLDELKNMDDEGTLLIKFSTDGIFPVYLGGERPNEWGALDDDALMNGWWSPSSSSPSSPWQSPNNNNKKKYNEIPKETEQVDLLLKEISLAVYDNAESPLHVIFEATLERLSISGIVEEKLAKRVANWKQKWAGIKQHIHKHTVREDLKDLAMWLLSPLHLEFALEVTLKLTDFSSAIELPRMVISLLGIDEMLSNLLQKTGSFLKQKYDNTITKIAAKYFLDENSISYLFLHEGQMAETKFRKAEKKVFRLSEEEALHLLKGVTESVVEERGKTNGHMVEKTLGKLKHWKHEFVTEAKQRWDSLKKTDMKFLRQDLDNLKYILYHQHWLTTERALTVLDIIFQMTKLNGAISIASEAMQMLGIQSKVFEWLDEKAATVFKKHILRNHRRRGPKPYVVKFVVAANSNEGSTKQIGGGSGQGKLVEIPIHSDDDEGIDMDDNDNDDFFDDDSLMNEKPKWTVLVHKGPDGQYYGVLEPIEQEGGGRQLQTGWQLVDDLHSGYLLLKSTINTIRGNPSLELDELVKITYRVYGTRDRFGLGEDIISCVISVGCLPFFGSPTQKSVAALKWERIEIEEMRNIRHTKEFLQEQKNMKKIMDANKRMVAKQKNGGAELAVRKSSFAQIKIIAGAGGGVANTAANIDSDYNSDDYFISDSESDNDNYDSDSDSGTESDTNNSANESPAVVGFPLNLRTNKKASKNVANNKSSQKMPSNGEVGNSNAEMEMAAAKNSRKWSRIKSAFRFERVRDNNNNNGRNNGNKENNASPYKNIANNNIAIMPVHQF